VPPLSPKIEIFGDPTHSIFRKSVQN